MKAFADLYERLDSTTSTNARIDAMADYFRAATPADAAWAVYFLAGGKPRQLVPSRVLREFASSVAGIPQWLLDECYLAVGDFAELLALLSPPASRPVDTLGLALWLDERLLPLRGQQPEAVLAILGELWTELDRSSRFVCAKLMTGSLRVGVSRLMVTRALAKVCGVDAKRIAERLVGYTDISARPDGEAYAALVAPDTEGEGDARRGTQPYPFFLAHPLQEEVGRFEQRLGPASDWLVEWKWDGIRAQLVRRQGRVALWSRGEELITERFPEIAAMGARLPMIA